MSTIQIVSITIVICTVYLFVLIKEKRYRMLLPCTIHTITWLAVSILIYFTIKGKIGFYDPLTASSSYDYVAPYILALIISSIVGFTLAHFGKYGYNESQLSINEDYLDRILKKFHPILYICFITGLIQAWYFITTIGLTSLVNYRMAVVTMNRTGIGAIVGQISGHVTILGTFYIALLGYKMGMRKFEMKRFLWDTFLLASVNLSLAGRGWILSALIPFFATYFWQKNANGEKLWNKESKYITFILIAFLSTFSIFGMLRNESTDGNSSNFVNKFLYYTDGSRIANYTFATIKDGTFDYEYGRSEFLEKWLGSPMDKRLNDIKDINPSLAVTVSSAIPNLYFDFGWWGGIFMWGVFCFILEKIANIYRYKHSIFAILIFMEATKILFQSPIGPVFGMEVPVIEWLIILYIFRNKLFRIS